MVEAAAAAAVARGMVEAPGAVAGGMADVFREQACGFYYQSPPVSCRIQQCWQSSYEMRPRRLRQEEPTSCEVYDHQADKLHPAYSTSVLRDHKSINVVKVRREQK